jgi:hypothetical protein
VRISEDERPFVRQLQLLAISSRSLELAIRDYKRAYMQRARWTDDALVSSPELRPYEERLLDEWEHVAASAWERTRAATMTGASAPRPRWQPPAATTCTSAAQFQRLRPRRGHGRALGAVKHSLLVACWHMLTTGELYREAGGDYFSRRDPERNTRRLVAQLERLGHRVTLDAAAT